jgi:hypothetical protein
MGMLRRLCLVVRGLQRAQGPDRSLPVLPVLPVLLRAGKPAIHYPTGAPAILDC